MKVSLVVTNSKRKSLVFVSNELEAYSLEEAVQLTREGKIEGAHVVKRGKDTFIRTNPNKVKTDDFDHLSVTAANLLLYAQGSRLTEVISPALKTFLDIYRNHLNKNEQLIKPVDQPEVLMISVKDKLLQHRSIIFDAAETYKIDPFLIGAILIDEIARLIPFESIADKFLAQILGVDASIGIAQVKTNTANDIIKQGLYNPNPDDAKLPFKILNIEARAHLYTYLIEPKHSIFFAAANIRRIINFWASKIDLTKRPGIIATLYPQGLGNPKKDPQPVLRGSQIAKEFYQLAKKWLY